MTHPTENDVLTASVADVARRLGLCVKTVHRLIAEGDLPSIKIGRRRLIVLEKLTFWLARKGRVGG